jgi:putative heme-binding domain-containing protein
LSWKKKRTPGYILGSMIDPSKDIEEKYALRTYLTKDGEVISGFVVRETDSEVHVNSDPLKQDKPTIVLKEDIEVQKKNEQSAMPNGLLNYFSKDEVLDLIAYVLTAADKNSELFKP